MISRTWSRKSIAFCVAVAVLSVYSMVALATPGQKAASGELSVSGQVTVNGQAAISGATVFSDSVIATAAVAAQRLVLGNLVALSCSRTRPLSLALLKATSQVRSTPVAFKSHSGGNTRPSLPRKTVRRSLMRVRPSTFMVDVECGNMIVASQAGRLNCGRLEGQGCCGRNFGIGGNSATRHALHQTDATGYVRSPERRRPCCSLVGGRWCSGSSNHRHYPRRRLYTWWPVTVVSPTK